MRTRSAFLILALLASLFFSSSCSYTSEAQQVTPAETQTADSLPEEQPTPQPTVILPVTNTGIPQFFMPGLSEIGTLPTGEYKIGVIINKSEQEENWWKEFHAISGGYEEKFDVDILEQATGGDTALQIETAKEMINAKIDLLIISPNESGMEELGDLCEKNSVPYITMNKTIAKTPGQGGYICSIERDEYLLGVLNGISIVKAMTDKYGYPKGNIGEITGEVTDSASRLRSMGLRRVFDNYDELNVVCSVAGDYDKEVSYKAAVNLLKAFRYGELDAVAAVCDDTAVQCLQAILDYGRDELIGNIWSIGATREGLTSVYYNDFAQTVECTCQTGMVALEYAIQYLEGQGKDIPPIVFSMSRVFSVETQQKADAIAKILADMKSCGTQNCLESIGSYELFLPDQSQLKEYYPKHYYEYSDAQAYLQEFEPYTTGEAFYAQAEQE